MIACSVTDDEDNALSVYYSKKSDRVQSELMVSVVKGNNLFNNLQETESKSEKCCVCISLCPDHEKRTMKSQYRYLTLQGSVRWVLLKMLFWTDKEKLCFKLSALPSGSGIGRWGTRLILHSAFHRNLEPCWDHIDFQIIEIRPEISIAWFALIRFFCLNEIFSVVMLLWSNGSL